VSVACDLTELGLSERFLNVTASDGTHFSDVMAVRVTLTDGRQRPDASATAAAAAAAAEEVPSFECRSLGLHQRLAEMAAASRKQNAPPANEIGCVALTFALSLPLGQRTRARRSCRRRRPADRCHLLPNAWRSNG